MKLNSELFCLLNANGIDIDHIPGGYGGLINPDSVRAAMAGSSRAEFALALYMAGEQKEFSNLWAGLFSRAINTNLCQQIKKKNKGKLDLLCRLAIFEFTHRPHCKQCHGSGVNSDYLTCNGCRGVGIKPISNRQRSAVIGKTHKSWYQFQDIYSMLLKTLQSWQDSNERKLNKKLR